MRAAICCLLFTLPLAAEVPAGAKASSITVLLDFENSHLNVPLKAMQAELGNILSDVGIAVDVRLKDELPFHPQFGELVIFKMKGQCSLDRLPIGALLDERGPLAMTYSSEGELLSFGEIECDRVRHSLQRIFGPNNLGRHESEYGKALGRVAAHEMYHMIAGSKAHTKEGLTKKSLSARDLTEGSLMLSNEAGNRLRRRLAPEPPSSTK